MIVPSNKMESPYNPYARASYRPVMNMEQNMIQSPPHMMNLAQNSKPATQVGASPVMSYKQPTQLNKPAASSASTMLINPSLSQPTQGSLGKSNSHIDNPNVSHANPFQQKNKWLWAALSVIPLLYVLVRERQFSKLKTTLTKVESENSSLLGSNTSLTTNFNQSKNAVNTLKAEIRQVEGQASEHQRLNTVLSDTNAQLRHDKTRLTGEVERLRNNNESLTTEAERLRSSHDSSMTETSRLRANNRRLMDEMARLRNYNENLRAEVTRRQGQLYPAITRPVVPVLEEQTLPEATRKKLADIRTILLATPDELEGITVNSRREGSQDVEICFLFKDVDNFPESIRTDYSGQYGAIQMYLPRGVIRSQVRRNKENLATFLSMPTFPAEIHFETR